MALRSCAPWGRRLAGMCQCGVLMRQVAGESEAPSESVSEAALAEAQAAAAGSAGGDSREEASSGDAAYSERSTPASSPRHDGEFGEYGDYSGRCPLLNPKTSSGSSNCRRRHDGEFGEYTDFICLFLFSVVAAPRRRVRRYTWSGIS